MQTLARLWRGELPLASAFWGAGVLGTGLVAVLSFVGNKITLGVFVWQLMRLMSGQASWSLVLAIGLVSSAMLMIPYGYASIVCVGIWRSSERYTGRASTAVLARCVACACWAVSISDILGGAYALQRLYAVSSQLRPHA